MMMTTMVVRSVEERSALLSLVVKSMLAVEVDDDPFSCRLSSLPSISG